MSDSDMRSNREAKLTPWTGYDENGVWLSAFKDEYGNIVPGHAIPNRVCGALGIAAGDRCQKPAGHDGPHEGAISADATRNRVATNMELRNSLARLIAIVIANAPKHYDPLMVAEDIIDRLDLNGCDIVNRRAT